MSWDWLEELAAVRREGRVAALVTVVKAAGSTPRTEGAKMLVLEDGSFRGSIGGGALEQRALDEARACLGSGATKLVHVPLGPAVGQCCGGVVDLFIEVVGVGPELVVFGAGHVAQALARVLEGTPFRVVVADDRAEWISQLPAHVTRRQEPWEDTLAGVRWDARRTYAAVMTHSHELDELIVRALLDRPLTYLGLIGSQTKWARFKKRLHARGAAPEAIERVKCPIGLATGGKAPQEVAISIAAELLQRHYGTT